MTVDAFTDTVTGISKKKKELESELRSLLGIAAKVHLVAPESIARSEGKSKNEL